jgi:hypothetical protein
MELTTDTKFRDERIDVLTFEDFTDAIRAAESDIDTKIGSGASRREEDSHWAGTKDFPSAMRLATEGWPEGQDHVARFAKRIDVSGRVTKPEIIYDVTGNGGFDMGRVLAGVPECAMEWAESEQILESKMHGKIVHIGFNFCVSAGVSREIIERRGAVVLALCNALETAGRRVEITAQYGSAAAYGNGFEIYIPLKAAGYQPQEDQLAFALVHGSMLRRIGFSLVPQCGANGRRESKRGYGLPTDNPFGDIYIPGALYGNSDWSSDANAIKWMLRVLREQGVELDLEGGK